MKLRHLPARFVLSLILASAAPEFVRAQAPAASPPEQAANAALDMLNAGQYAESAAAYEDIIKKYPTSLVFPEAQFRLGYVYYLLADFDKSLTYLNKLGAPGSSASPEIQEIGFGLIPQAMAAKAGKLTDEPKRVAAYEAAIKQFDAFLAKYPSSDQTENIVYGRALACYQISKFDDAIKSLRSNLQRFPKSESILDSQYILALTLATQANIAAQESAGNANPAADIKYGEAEGLLRDIIAKKTDLALVNDAQFQIGELLFNRGALGASDKAQEVWSKATDAYRAVQPKEPMVQAQQARIAGVTQRRFEALKAKNLAEMKRLDALRDHEAVKLETVKGKPDLTVSARIKVGQIFLQEKEYDGARVLLHQLQQFAEDEEQKKTLQYYVTLSYASQRLTEQAVKAYDEFQSAYKADPIADNLPLVIGSLFLTNDPATNNPEKAVEYFKESIALYPAGRCIDTTLTQQATALIQLKQYDEAISTFRNFLKKNPKPELAVAAEFGIALVLKDTGKVGEAIEQFKKVRTTYPGTPQAEQASFWVPQLALGKSDLATAIPEFTAFLKNFPKSEMYPTAKFGLGQAQLGKQDKAAAMQTFKEVADEFPKTEAAPYTYFQRASILGSEGKVDDMVALMKEFIERYSDSDKIFFAYDIIGQSQINGSKPMEAIATYNELVEKHPNDAQAAAALLHVVELWKEHAASLGKYLAQNEQERAEWNKGVNGSVAAAEKLLGAYPASPQVATTLGILLDAQKLLLSAKLKTEEGVATYFQELAAKFADKPETKSKVLFTLAAFIYEKDKVKALEQMNAAYDSKLVYAPATIDLYGTALLETGKTKESAEVYEDLASDYPNPPGVSPEKAPVQIAEAQAIALYGIGKAQQKEGRVAEAQGTFENLKKLYPWSPKLLEADFGIAQGLTEKNKPDEAMPLLVAIIRAPTGSAELHANAMLLLAKILEAKGDLPSAIDNYIKISVYYESVGSIAAEGLWKGAQLLEKQAATLPDKPVKPKDPTKPGQMAKAVRYYQELSTKFPTSPHGAEAKARFEALQPPKK